MPSNSSDLPTIDLQELVTKFKERNHREPRNAGELTQFCKQLRDFKPITYGEARKYFQKPKKTAKPPRTPTEETKEEQDATEEKNEEEAETATELPTATETDPIVEASPYQEGDEVTLTMDRTGTIRFVGMVEFAEGLWYGVELHEQFAGRCDGEKDGKRYFECNPKRGIFVQEDKIRRKMSRADYARKNSWIAANAELTKLTLTASEAEQIPEGFEEIPEDAPVDPDDEKEEDAKEVTEVPTVDEVPVPEQKEEEPVQEEPTEATEPAEEPAESETQTETEAEPVVAPPAEETNAQEEEMAVVADEEKEFEEETEIVESEKPEEVTKVPDALNVPQDAAPEEEFDVVDDETSDPLSTFVGLSPLPVTPAKSPSSKQRKSVSFKARNYFAAQDGQNLLHWVVKQTDMNLRSDLMDLYLGASTTDRLRMVFSDFKFFTPQEQQSVLMVDVLPRLLRELR